MAVLLGNPPPVVGDAVQPTSQVLSLRHCLIYTYVQAVPLWSR